MRRSVGPSGPIVKQSWYRRPVSRRVALGAILAGLAVLTLAACVSTKDNGRGFDAGARRRFVVNWTTRGEVEARLGRPKAVTTGNDGEETWVYEHTTVWAVRYPIPFWRPVSVGQTPRDTLTIRFTYGVLSGCSFARERYTTQDGRIVAAGTTTEECAK